jgi:hypothetical protein
MTAEEFRRERLYQITLSIARAMRDKGLISDSELRELDKTLLAKYHPLLGSLSA